VARRGARHRHPTWVAPPPHPAPLSPSPSQREHRKRGLSQQDGMFDETTTASETDVAPSVRDGPTPDSSSAAETRQVRFQESALAGRPSREAGARKRGPRARERKGRSTQHFDAGLINMRRRKSAEPPGRYGRVSEELGASALALAGRVSDGDGLLDEDKVMRDLLPCPAAIRMNQVTLTFQDSDVEDHYLADVATRRWPVLIFIAMFDVFAYFSRFLYKMLRPSKPRGEIVIGNIKQLANMLVLYSALTAIYWWSRKYQKRVARIEETVLTVLMSVAITLMLTHLPPDKAMDYVLFAFFLICISTFMQVRWWLGTVCLFFPTALSFYWYSSGRLGLMGASPPGAPPTAYPVHMREHVAMAWSIGCLMSYLAETYRRQMFANHKLAADAAARELLQAKERIKAQKEAGRYLKDMNRQMVLVEREKAANEAKSEFMSLMCHEVRTPLNGCLASAEMILETELDQDQFELASTIRVSGSILLSTVSNFLDYFKLEAGKQLDVVRQEVNIRGLVHDIHLIIDAMINKNGDRRLRMPDTAGLPEVVLADSDRLRGVILNLMTNAVKFTKRGHIGVRVSVMRAGEHPVPDDAMEEKSSEDGSAERHRSRDGRAPAATARRRSQPVVHERRRHSVVINQRHSYVCRNQESAQAPASSVSAADSAEERARVKSKSIDVPSLLAKKEGVSRRPKASFLSSINEEQAGDDASGRDGEPAAGAGSARGGSGGGGSPGAARPERPARPGARASLDTRRGSVGSLHSDSRRSSLEITKTSNTEQPADAGSAVRASVVAASRESEDAAHWLVFEVSDTGVGIPPGGLKKLFNAFVQGVPEEMHKPRSTGGTGLGLSICAKQVGFLGGCIGAHSLMGEGSTFWFSVPLVLPARHAGIWSFQQYTVIRELLLAEQRSRGFQEFAPVHISPGARDPFTGPYGTGTYPPYAGLAPGPAPVKGPYPAVVPAPRAPPRAPARDEAAGGRDRRSQDRGVDESPRISITGLTPDGRAVVINFPTLAPGAPPAPGGGSVEARAFAGLGALAESQARTSKATDAAPPAARPHSEEQARGSPAVAAKWPDHRSLHEATSGPPPRLHQSAGSAQDPAAAAASAVPGGGSAVESLSGLFNTSQREVEQFERLLSKHSSGSNLANGLTSRSASSAHLPRAAHSLTGEARGSPAARGPARSEAALSVRPASTAPLSPEAARSNLQSALSAWKRTRAPAAPSRARGDSSGFRGGGVAGPPPGQEAPAPAGARAQSLGLTVDPPPAPAPAPAPAGPPRGPSPEALGGPAAHTPRGRVESPLLGGPGRASMCLPPPWETCAAEAPGRRESVAGIRVLLVEDNHINQKVACKVLKLLQAECEVANNGREAVEAVAGRPGAFDVVLMDMLMPEMGGVDATREIRRRGSAVPILAMTANASAKDREACREVGMNGFISKPVLKGTLNSAILALLNGDAVWEGA